jgi:hypothetical protein
VEHPRPYVPHHCQPVLCPVIGHPVFSWHLTVICLVRIIDGGNLLPYHQHYSYSYIFITWFFITIHFALMPLTVIWMA